MHINEESLRNITVRKNKHNFQLTTTEDHRRLSFNTETVSPTFPLEYYPRIGDTPTQNDQVSVINDYDELNTILQREAEERSVFSQTAQTENYTQIENSKASPPKQRKLRCRNKKKLLIIPEENVENMPEPCTISQGDPNSVTPHIPGQSKKSPSNVSDEPSPTPSHETIDFPLSPNRANRGPSSDSCETFFDPTEETEQGKGQKVNDRNEQPIPEEENATERMLCNITYRSKRKVIPWDDELFSTKPDYAKSMADIFTDTTIADLTNKSEDKKTKHNLPIEPCPNSQDSGETSEKDKCNHCGKCDGKNNSRRNQKKCNCTKTSKRKNTTAVSIHKKYFLRSKIVNLTDSNLSLSKKHDISISTQTTESTKDKNQQHVDSRNALTSSTQTFDKAVGTDGDIERDEEDVRQEMVTEMGIRNEIEYLGTKIMDDDSPSQWSRIGVRRKNRPQRNPLKTPQKHGTNLHERKSLTPSNLSVNPSSSTHTPSKELKNLSKTPPKASYISSIAIRKSHPVEPDTNPVVLLTDRDIVHQSPVNQDILLRNQSIQTHSSESSFETKPVKTITKTRGNVKPLAGGFCKSCQKRGNQDTSIQEKNCGSYEVEDEDFVSNDVSNMSGIVRLGTKSESHKPETSSNGKLMKGLVAYVDVRLDGSDKSRGVVRILNHLGAHVSKSLDKNVTHIIFYEGALSTVEKARQWNIPLVSVEWVNACRSSKLVLSSEAFPPVHIEDYLDSIRQNKDEIFRAMLRTVAKDLDEIVASNASVDNIEVPLSILILRKYMTPYETDSEHQYNLASIEISLSLDRRKRLLLRRLVFPNRSAATDSSGSDWSLSPVILEPRCSAPARLCSRSKLKHRASKEMQYEEEVQKIRSILGTQKKSEGKERRNEVDTQNKLQNINDVINRLRTAPEKTPKTLEPGPSKPNPSTPHFLAAKKRIHFRRSSLPNRLKKGETPRPSPLISKPVNNKVTLSYKTPVCSTLSDEIYKRVQSVDWRSGSELISSSEMPAVPGKRKIRKRRLYEEVSTLEDPLQSAKKKTSRRKPGRKPAAGLVNEQKYSDVYDTNRADTSNPDSSRSSSYWFVSQSERIEKSNDKTRTQKQKNGQKPGLVCTGITSKDIKTLYSYITELGHFVIEPKVTSRTTHVVVEGPKRTLNLLKGIARGCWVVKQEWVLASFNVGRWLYEQRFELTSFSSAVQRCRMERQTFGPLYSFSILSKLGPIFVSKTSRPPRADLQELILLCGGRLAPSMREASIVVGGGGGKTGHRDHLSEVWLLDCVTKCSQLDMDKYRL